MGKKDDLGCLADVRVRLIDPHTTYRMPMDAMSHYPLPPMPALSIAKPGVAWRVKKSNQLMSHLHERDEGLCGVHLMGCRKVLDLADATVDHIIPKSFYPGIQKLPSHIMGAPWNLQLMHESCNKEKAGYFLSYPAFQCKCHAILIRPDGTAWLFTKSDTMDKDWHHVLLFDRAIQEADSEFHGRIYHYIKDTRRSSYSAILPIGLPVSVALGIERHTNGAIKGAFVSISRPTAEYRNIRVISMIRQADEIDDSAFPMNLWVPKYARHCDQFPRKYARFEYANDPLRWDVKRPTDTSPVTYTLKSRKIDRDGLHMGEFGYWA